MIMPLFHKSSDKAFKHNVKAEMNAGKSQGQSLAIAYHVKRKAKAKGVADGGEVVNPDGPCKFCGQHMCECGMSEGGMVSNEGGDPTGIDFLGTNDDLEFSETGSNSGDFLGEPEEAKHEGDVERGKEGLVDRIIKRMGSQPKTSP